MFSIPGKSPVTITPAAEAQIARLMTGKGAAGLRIGLKKGGCAGMEYTMEMAETPAPGDEVVEQGAARVMIDLLGVATAGGMFVVPLYAFLTTTVPKAETARTVAANNIVNSGAMVFSTLLIAGLVAVGVTVAETLLIVAVGSLGAAWIAWRLHKACD